MYEQSTLTEVNKEWFDMMLDAEACLAKALTWVLLHCRVQLRFTCTVTCIKTLWQLLEPVGVNFPRNY